MGLVERLRPGPQPSQVLRRHINGSDPILIVPSFDPANPDHEKRIQPSSYDPVLSSSHPELYILDTEQGVFQPTKDMTIYEQLLRVPRLRRQRRSYEKGFVLQRGFTYAVPLEERLMMHRGLNVDAVPKSSRGRNFIDTRMLCDHNSYVDRVLWQTLDSKAFGMPLNLWLLITPSAFNVTIKPGLPMNQLIVYAREPSPLTPKETRRLADRRPLLYVLKGERHRPAKHIVTEEGLHMHLDLEGRGTEGIVALRARANPDPIDLSAKEAFDVRDYFETVSAGQFRAHQGEHYLLMSKEVVRMPEQMCSVLRRTTRSVEGPVNYAPLVDAGFCGRIMCHWRCIKDNEPLRDGMVISSMDIFRIDKPDKVYGAKIGSSYQMQRGLQPASNFKRIDYAILGKKIAKLQGKALLQDALSITACRSRPEGFEFFTESTREAMLSCVQQGFFQVRDECEDDDLLLQPIPYVIIVGKGNRVFAYRRAEDIKKYAEPKLFGKWSIGVGGHIGEADMPGTVGDALRTKMAEEVRFARSHTTPELIGSLIMRDLPVDRVHLGLIHLTYTDGDVQPRSKGLTQGRFAPIDYLLKDVHAKDRKGEYKYESWSRALIPLLPGIVRR